MLSAVKPGALVQEIEQKELISVSNLNPDKNNTMGFAFVRKACVCEMGCHSWSLADGFTAS